MSRLRLPLWFLFLLVVAVLANQAAGYATRVTVGLMSSTTDFAREVRAFSETVLPWWRAVNYALVIGALVAYLRPVLAYFACGGSGEADVVVQRRAVSFPLVLAAAGFLAWAFGVPVFAGLTLWRFGHWSPELMSQQVISPLVNGFLASIVTFMVGDRVFRLRVYPVLFPDGGLADVPGTWVIGVRGRLLFFLLAVAFLPLFTMLGLIRAAAVRLEGGMDAVELLANLTSAAESTFLVYVVLGLWLTLILARSQTRPLEQAAKALRRIRDGDLDVDLRSASADEIGRMEDGVHELAATLRDRERILRTFGRIVDPVVRDHLLSGRYDSGGETLEATIMFCDLRGFTAMSENREPAEVVATINQFFTLMTDEVRRHGGFVDKFIGDALLVVFGLFSKEPIEEGDEGGTATAGADAAVRAGLAMRKLVGESGRASRGAQAPRLEISVAIHTGRVVAGMIGSADRHEYTVIGDTVNVAARLERVCKERGGGIVASTTTWQRARRAGVTATVVVEDTAELAGRREPVGYVVLESA